MDCGKPHDLIEAEIDGTIDAEGKAALDRHAEGCASCRRAREDALFSRDQFEVVGLEDVPAKLSSTLDARIGEMAAVRRRKKEAVRTPWWIALAETLARPRSLVAGAAALAVLLFVGLQARRPAEVGLGIPVMHVAGSPAPVESPAGLGLHRGAYLVTRMEQGRHLRAVAEDTVLTLARATLVCREQSELFFATDDENGSPTQALQLRAGSLWVASAPGDGFRIATPRFECFAASGSLFELAVEGVKVLTGAVRVRRGADETTVREGHAFDGHALSALSVFDLPGAVSRAFRAVMPAERLAHYLPRRSPSAGTAAGDETADAATGTADAGRGDGTVPGSAAGSGERPPQVDALSGLMGGAR